MKTITAQFGGMKRLFHYTRLSRLESILSDGEIKLATSNVLPPEKAVVWFSYRQEWEPTATPVMVGFDGTLVDLTFDELTQRDTPARIEIDPLAAPLTWRAWRKTSGVNRRVAKALQITAMAKDSNSADWRMSFEPVRSEHWRAIEIFVGGRWSQFEGTSMTRPADAKTGSENILNIYA